MIGKWNPKTRRYEDDCGNEIIKSNLEQESIVDKDLTYIERYAKELSVSSKDLFENIVSNNSLELIANCDTYQKFRRLKQTLVVKKKRPTEELFDVIVGGINL